MIYFIIYASKYHIIVLYQILSIKLKSWFLIYNCSKKIVLFLNEYKTLD